MKYSLLFLMYTVSLIFRLLLLQSHLTDPKYSIQQDHYADYARALQLGTLNDTSFLQEDRRLLPGYPVVIAIFSYITRSTFLSGVLISLVSYTIALWLILKLTNSRVLTMVYMFFPPVWINQTIKIATEPLVVVLLLGTLYLFIQKKYLLTGIILGLAFDVRLIAVCLLAALILQPMSLVNKKKVVLGFASTAVLLFIYNAWQFGIQHVFIQFTLYPEIGKGTVGFVQVIKDILRTLDWRQYRIFISGILYLLFNILGVVLLYKLRNKSQLFSIAFYWSLFSLVFIGMVGPTPLLEEFARFSVPIVPALLLGYADYIDSKKDTYVKMR